MVDWHADELETALKKHGKADEDARYQGTLLGREAESQAIPILGGPQSSLAEWMEKFKAEHDSPVPEGDESTSPAESSMLSTAPGTPGADVAGVDEGTTTLTGTRTSIQT
jgi:hypothetical protein